MPQCEFYSYVVYVLCISLALLILIIIIVDMSKYRPYPGCQFKSDLYDLKREVNIVKSTDKWIWLQ